jgi:hypothetical protein
MKKENSHWGTILDAFLTEESIREAAKAEALTRVVAWQLEKGMGRQGITKAQLADLRLMPRHIDPERGRSSGTDQLCGITRRMNP